MAFWFLPSGFDYLVCCDLAILSPEIGSTTAIDAASILVQRDKWSLPFLGRSSIARRKRVAFSLGRACVNGTFRGGGNAIRKIMVTSAEALNKIARGGIMPGPTSSNAVT